MSSLYGRSNMGGKTGDIIPKGYEKGQIQQFTPEMMELFKSLFSHVSPDSFLSRVSRGDQKTFDEMEAPALKQFSGLQGNLASRFSGMGIGGRHSSGFQNTANQAASDFSEQLQSRRMELQRQATGDLFNLSNTLLSQRPQEQFLTKKEDFLSQLLKFWGNNAQTASKIASFAL
jgi:hypothetical protein